jgi:hypothetical protein
MPARAAHKVRNALAEAVRAAMTGAHDCRTRGNCDDCAACYDAVMNLADRYAAARELQPAPELAAKPMPRVDWARVSEAAADRERERDEARADRDDYAARLRAADQSWTRLSVERDSLRELLDEIGVMAANAPEGGDSFGLLEDIAMRIAAVGVPDSTSPDEWPAATPSPVLLDAYKGDNRRLRGRLDVLLGRFAPDRADYRASLSAAELAQEYRDVPLPVPDQLRHLEER